MFVPPNVEPPDGRRRSGTLGAALAAARPPQWRGTRPRLRRRPRRAGRSRLAGAEWVPAPALAVMTAAAYLADHDPFRLTRQPARVAFGAPDPVPVIAGAAYAFPAPPAPPGSRRPGRLALQGVVGAGAQWAAVVSGLPGRDGAVPGLGRGYRRRPAGATRDPRLGRRRRLDTCGG
jgi:hypothetical protein